MMSEPVQQSTGGKDCSSEERPKSVRRSRRLIHKDVPGLGSVTFTSVTIGVTDHAGKLARESKEDNPADVFTNFILSRMLVVPAKTADEVANLPGDAVRALVENAVDLLAVRNEYDCIPSQTTPRERLYRAYGEYQRKFAEEVMASIQKSIGGSLEQIYGQAAEVVRGMAFPKDVLKNVADGFREMSCVNTVLASFRLPTNSLLIGREMQQLGEIAMGISSEPLRNMAKQIASLKLPEPFLSDALIASGLNSSSIHSPTYAPLRIPPMRNAEDVRARTVDAYHRRLVDAYDIISYLEQTLRDFIESRLRQRDSERWWKRGVPEAIRKACEGRKSEKEKSPEVPYQPIYYAYMDDYKAIIVNAANWGTVFALVFGNKAEVEVSLTRICRIRNDVAHSRPISDEDYKMLVVESNFLQAAINRALKLEGFE